MAKSTKELKAPKRAKHPPNPIGANDPLKWKYHHIPGDLVQLNEKGWWIVVPTNGEVDSKGRAVMGAGLAKQVASENGNLPIRLGKRLRLYGNHVNVFPDLKIITFPTKHKWSEKSDIELIKRGLIELDLIILHAQKHYGGLISHVYVPRLGCGAGGLDFVRDVEPLISVAFRNDSHYTLVSTQKDYDEHYGHEIRTNSEGSSTQRRRAGDKSRPPF